MVSLFFSAFLSMCTVEALWPGALFGTTQYQWNKSMNFSFYTLPSGKGERQEKTGKWVFQQRAH